MDALALGSRRRALAASVSVVLAVALAAAISGRRCSADDETPEGAVQAFAAAARAGDRDAVYQLLGPQTRARLERDAQRADEMVGGSRRFDPRELIGLSRPGVTRPAPQGFERRSLDGDTAVVDIIGPDGERSSITVVRVDGVWRIEL